MENFRKPIFECFVFTLASKRASERERLFQESNHYKITFIEYFYKSKCTPLSTQFSLAHIDHQKKMREREKR